jgi:hypothetical protein
MKKLTLTLILLGSFLKVLAAEYPENRDYGQLGEFLWKEGVQFGRTANLTNIGPYLVNLPEGPGSTGVGLPGNQYLAHDTIWDLTDLANPLMVHEFNQAGQPIHAHGTVIRFSDNGPRLMARASGDIGYNTANQEFVIDELIVPAEWPSDVFGYSMMTSPYYVRNYWTYDLNRNGVFAIHDPANPLEQPSPNEWSYTDGPLFDLFGGDLGVWLGVPYVYWDHFNVADVTGFSAFMGNLMVMASDQLSTGMAIYDVSGVREGRAPRLLSTYQPQRIEPNGNPIGVGGYWVEPYGTTKMVYAARESESIGRSYPAMYVIDFEDPYNPRLTCEIYFDQDRTPNGAGTDRSDGDWSSDPMYVNFQDEYIYVDHFKVDLPACEEAFEAGNTITGEIFDEVVYRFNDIDSGCDGSQYFRPLGQVGVFGGYDWWETPNVNEQGMCAFVTSNEPDNKAPFVSGHRPLANQESYPIDGFIHIHIPETLRTETVENAITITNTGTNETINYRMLLSHSGTISIFPLDYLNPNSSYQVDIVGIQDYMGNTMVNYSFNFTTGSADLLQGDTPFPEFDYLNPPPPAVIQSGDPDDNGGTGGGSEEGPAPTYSGTAYFPIQSSPIACTSETESGDIWAVNPDNGSVSIISSEIDEGTMVKTHQMEQEVHLLYESPTSVTRLNNSYAITFSLDDKVVFFDSLGNPLSSIDTGHGTQPIAAVTDNQHLYAALYGSGEIIKINLNSKTIVERLPVGPKPKAMALYGNRLLVTRFISPLDHGEVYDIDISSNMRMNGTIVINKLILGDDIDHGAGVPNYLSSIVISEDGQTAYISATKANTDRGTSPGSNNPQHLDGDNTVRPMIAILDLVNNQDANTDPATRSGTIDLDNSADPSAVTFLANGDVRVTALQGNNILVFNDMVQNAQAQFNTQGAPQGMCATRRTLYVKNHTSRSISAIDVAGYMAYGDLQQVTEHIATVQNEILTEEEKRGLEIFYHSSMPEMGPEGYMTCASCHFDGGHDGRVWDITNLGEGLRNTISLNGASGTRFGALHWSGNFDEVQDFELQMEKLNGGEGLIPGATFNDESPLEIATSGQSVDLDALATYITGLGKDSVKHSPYRAYTGELTESAIRGETLFTEAGCNSCHSGKAFRDGVTHDVGTINTESGNRLGEIGGFTQVRTPTLIELWDSAPYFHNGSAATLEDVLSIGSHAINLSDDEREDLINFLLSIDRAMYIEDDEEFIPN